jgi:hypothetical protein
MRKLLRYFYLPNNQRIALLRSDIRSEIARAAGATAEGGDFYVPFWADAKAHVAGEADLLARVEERIESNERRARLYPELASGFLAWWNERRRWRNEPFEVLSDNVRTQLVIPELEAIIKVENILSLRIGDESHRIIYPYFSEEPPLPEEGRRFALALMHEALPNFALDDLRVLDILRASSYGIIDHPLLGDERQQLVRQYQALIDQWEALYEEYENEAVI